MTTPTKTARWMFFYENGNIRFDATDLTQEAVVKEAIMKNPQGFLELPGDESKVLVNLSLVKCITRSLVDLEEEKRLQDAAIAKAAEQAQEAPQG
jgi:hypothetical protein